MRVSHFPRVPGVYKITCKVDGKIYVGSSVNIGKRLRAHYQTLKENKHTSRHLQRAYNKYGEYEFEACIILTCDRTDLLIFEQFYIDTLQPQFNSCKTAGNMLGFRHSQETRQKMSNSSKGRVPHNKGKKASDELRQKLSKAHIGLTSSRVGMKHSEESKRKMSASKTGIKQSDELIAKRVASFKKTIEKRKAVKEKASLESSKEADVN